jgi:DNA-binding NtrC family response regulator
MDEAHRILVIDDEQTIRQGLVNFLRELGHEVEAVADAERGMERALDFGPDLVIVDLNLPGKNGLDFIADLMAQEAESTVIVLTGHATIDSAIAATRRGVYDYLEKPIDRERLSSVVRKGLERATLHQEVAHLRREMARSGRLQDLVGKSPRMIELYRIIDQIAPTNASVLITGESGTGKDVTARTIHRLSPRVGGRLVSINCAAIPETLLESEIFGHERGSFTGATSSRQGCFELAHQGTIFLDEIGQMPIHLQSKLLRILEDSVVRRVGGSTEIKVDVRLLAATNAPIEEQIAKGTFREDLYYRLNVFNLHLPPLRERTEDIPLLAEHFLREFNPDGVKPILGFSAPALNLLISHPWPGNVRELRNAVQRSVILCQEGEIQAHHLPDSIRSDSAPRAGIPAAAPEGASPPAGAVAERAGVVRLEVGTPLAEAERTLIHETLASCHGNKTKTASLLGISVKTLYTKLRLYADADANPSPSS